MGRVWCAGMYKCFVICPFGEEDGAGEKLRLFNERSGLRKHVFPRVEAICRERGFPIEIADGERTATPDPAVRAATQRGIDEADAVIVLLTEDNPNVYVEFGWAVGMWHHPIILYRKGYKLPIDIVDLLHLEYGDSHVSGANKDAILVLADKLAKALVEKIVKSKTDVPFGHWPQTTLARGRVKVYNRFSKAFTRLEWSEVFRSATSEIIVASTGMSKVNAQGFIWAEPGRPPVEMGLAQMLLLKAHEGVKVTVVFYHESNVTDGHLKQWDGGVEERQNRIRSSFRFWSTFRLAYESERQAAESKGDFSKSKPGGGFEVIQLYGRHLPFRVTLTEQQAIVTVRFYTEVYNSGLCIVAKAADGLPDPDNMPVYNQVRRELDFLINESKERSEENYRNWLAAGRPR
ncbi:TIR domain-containing protein [Mesorhizobium comanense]|uniref:hypothetical protein n=1 Tax=Mesorhizobium comanense TaxID=2502215 RepID=UPI0010F65692|nr:hypothetical protein [Mesorhizobium comanense]